MLVSPLVCELLHDKAGFIHINFYHLTGHLAQKSYLINVCGRKRGREKESKGGKTFCQANELLTSMQALPFPIPAQPSSFGILAFNCCPGSPFSLQALTQMSPPHSSLPDLLHVQARTEHSVLQKHIGYSIIAFNRLGWGSLPFSPAAGGAASGNGPRLAPWTVWDARQASQVKGHTVG